MAQVIDRRVTAELDGPFVVFLLGMRINKFWKIWKWLPIFSAMPRMISELEQRPDSGFLGASRYLGSPRRPMLIQYWRSFQHLESYARNRDGAHWPAWVEFNKRVGSSGDVGIWHEAYLVPAGGYECIYNNMPPTGLGAVATVAPAVGRKATAASRAELREETYPDGAATERGRGMRQPLTRSKAESGHGSGRSRLCRPAQQRPARSTAADDYRSGRSIGMRTVRTTPREGMSACDGGS